MLVSESKKKKKKPQATTTTTKKPPNSVGPYVISWIVYKIDSFLGNYRKALWLLFKMQFFISLQNTYTHTHKTLPSTDNVHIWKQEDEKESRSNVFLSAWRTSVFLLNQATSISFHNHLKYAHLILAGPAWKPVDLSGLMCFGLLQATF